MKHTPRCCEWIGPWTDDEGVAVRVLRVDVMQAVAAQELGCQWRTSSQKGEVQTQTVPASGRPRAKPYALLSHLPPDRVLSLSLGLWHKACATVRRAAASLNIHAYKHTCEYIHACMASITTAAPCQCVHTCVHIKCAHQHTCSLDSSSAPTKEPPTSLTPAACESPAPPPRLATPSAPGRGHPPRAPDHTANTLRTLDPEGRGCRKPTATSSEHSLLSAG